MAEHSASDGVLEAFHELVGEAGRFVEAEASGGSGLVLIGRKRRTVRKGNLLRSLVGNTVFRYKSILGQRMRSRSLGNQRVEVRLACKILNTMTRLGMPDSYRVT